MSYDFYTKPTINFLKYAELSALIFLRGIINSHLSTCSVLYLENKKIILEFLIEFIDDEKLKIVIIEYIKNPNTTNAKISYNEIVRVLKNKNFSDVINTMQ